MIVAGWSVLVIEHVTFSPRPTSTAPPAVTGVALPEQVHTDGAYPGPPDSESWKAPTGTNAPVTEASPVRPVTVVGPMADRIQSVGTPVPPERLLTTFYQRDRRADRGVGDRARRVLALGEGDGGGRRRGCARAHPGRSGVAGRAGLGQRVLADLDGAVVTAAEPVAPLIDTGPEADSVQAVAGVVAPVVPLSTTLTSVSVGMTAVLTIVQVACRRGRASPCSCRTCRRRTTTATACSPPVLRSRTACSRRPARWRR